MGYTITPGLGGIWSIEKDPARTDLPVENTPIENLGIYKEGFEADELRNWDGSGCQLCVGQASEAFFKIDVHDIHVNWTGKQKAIERWFATYAANLGKVEVDLRAGVDKVVIMPVADVVEFHDLNANQGHVYSSIDFPFLTPQVTKLL